MRLAITTTLFDSEHRNCLGHVTRWGSPDAYRRAAAQKDGPVVTDNGNLVLDCDFGTVDDPAALAARLSALPGAVEHGLFVGLADEVHVGHDDGVDVHR